MFHRIRVLLMASACLTLAMAADAAPPEGEEARLYKGHEAWFKSLWNPAFDGSCCDLSDCRYVSYRATSVGYVVEIHGQSIPVPRYAVIDKHDNPTGRGVACYRPTGNAERPYEVMCFVRAQEG